MNLFSPLLPTFFALLIYSTPSRALTLPDTLTIVSYNVENLFDLQADNTDYPAYSLEIWNITSFRAKIKNIAQVLTTLKGDIVVLSEIESPQALFELNKQMKREGVIYPYSYVAPKAKGQSQSDGLLSTYPILTTTLIPTHLPNGRQSRQIIQADIGIGDDTLTLFINHWPSKAQPESFRIAVAKTLDSALTHLSHNRPFIIAGDLNENYDEQSQFLMTTCGKGSTPCDDTQGATALSTILPLTLYNPWIHFVNDTLFSYLYKKEPQMIDHIIFSPHFFTQAPFTYIPHSFTPHTLKGLLIRNGAPYRWQIQRGDTPRHKNRGYSDHLPLTAQYIYHPLHPTPEPTTLTGSFEQGRDGWHGYYKGVTIFRSSSNAIDGSTSLKIKGIQKGSGITTRFHAITLHATDTLSFYIKGSGVAYFRLRSTSTPSWHYYTMLGKQRSSAHYLSFTTDTNWQRISFNFPYQPQDTLTLELRSKGGQSLDLLIDSVSLSGSLR